MGQPRRRLEAASRSLAADARWWRFLKERRVRFDHARLCLQASATTCTKRKRKAPQAWLSGEAVEMAIAAANLAAAGEESSTCTAQGAEGGDVPAATTAASTKLTRFEAMWTDCDPELWEYVVV